VPVVYEPHCFKFDDPSVSKLLKFAYFNAERLLARNCTAFATLSTHETGLARDVAPQVPSVYLPNVPAVETDRNSFQGARTTFARVSMVGRISRQKDPTYFIEVARALKGLGSGLKPVWIGDGTPKLRAMLESNGVEVTGWLNGDELTAALNESIYCHTAAYEGFPLSVLDAAAINVPIVARAIPAFVQTPLAVATSPGRVAEMVFKLETSAEAQADATESNRVLLESYNAQNLRAKLESLYLLARDST
jgi:glycosyltransferase involved in cell wall biosynthesis